MCELDFNMRLANFNELSRATMRTESSEQKNDKKRRTETKRDERKGGRHAALVVGPLI
jgi:hypothetical protein